MSILDGFRHLDLTARQTGAEYLRLYNGAKVASEKLDNQPEDVLRRGGEVHVVEGLEQSEQFSLSYQRPDVIANESLILRRSGLDGERYFAHTVEFGREGSLLEVTHSLDETKNTFGDETRTVLYIDPESSRLFSTT